MVFACVARFWLLWDKPLWRDEAWVGYLIGLPYREILISHQPIPAGFALLAKAVAAAGFMPVEISLRLPSLLAGLGTVALLPALVRLMGGSRLAAVLSAWLAAGCQPLIYYSRELKHYGLDTFIWLLAACLVLLLLEERHPRPHRRGLWAGLALTLGTAPWFSFGSLFPLAAVLGLALFAAWRKERAQLLWGLGACAAWYLASLGLVLKISVLGKVGYVTSHPLAPTVKEMFHYQTAPGWDQVAQAFAWFFKVPISYIFPFAGFCLLPLLILGLWSWPRPFRAVLCWFISLTALLTVCASLINHYILMQRTLLFMAPVYLALAAQGGAWLWHRTWSKPVLQYPAKGVAVGLVLLSLTWGGLSMLSRAGHFQNGRQMHFYYDEKDCVAPALDFAARVASPGEPVLLTRYAGTQFLFYRQGRLPRATHWYHTDPIDEKAEFIKWLKTIRTRGWLIFLDNEPLPWLAEVISEQGFSEKKAFAGRGSNVWLVEPAK